MDLEHKYLLRKDINATLVQLIITTHDPVYFPATQRSSLKKRCNEITETTMQLMFMHIEYWQYIFELILKNAAQNLSVEFLKEVCKYDNGKFVYHITDSPLFAEKVTDEVKQKRAELLPLLILTNAYLEKIKYSGNAIKVMLDTLPKPKVFYDYVNCMGDFRTFILAHPDCPLELCLAQMNNKFNWYYDGKLLEKLLNENKVRIVAIELKEEPNNV